ncbi:PREDICTED: protein ROOT PRIMORDIUM DEFECTIVE 1-like [Nelumbo nucifera]|uniref:Protein ROOT PRIMORDIUM DEFECTIVE 1-like n=1 Tax=Nelumbo nucifera TaxID=4432 RepID=A0A1U8Q5C2_NELNU|nr:PREDICTED: protein ROOT PRIMORDIUM DEFECTIVE 1-like [Nelumbo nucifera]XP_010256305.1 PREDICTED: protein ROOT PRIMORDIUM DEFECTIVE 1-like [Nelumbo nucifera]XP_019053250.1 PREDICTED: protein ROOT PRIMORDIUM DEFECTIVE 1-like [Nelumbo nucifera]
MLVFSLSLVRRRPRQLWPSSRTFVDAKIKWVRDRGLDHAVEKEKHLRPMIALKNFIKSEPSKSLSVSVAAENKDRLLLPTRAIEFIRRYPSVFEEFFPGGAGVRPHVRLTPEVLRLDEEEKLIYDSFDHRQDAADRLLKLLMLTRVNKLPLHIIDRLRWDLGLPHDYVRTLLPDYPDYFQVSTITDTIGSGNGSETLALELVCWTNELAVSAMEKKAMAEGDPPYKKGMPLAFPLQFSRGFDMEKKVKKWVDEWQNLPYISPYENALHLAPKSDQAEKWTVAVLHELLHILISKKTERDNILCLGEYLGLRSRFKRALMQHPGIFYLSNKIRTHTVVLREAYKRDLLVEKHPLMGMRYQYIHLMNKEKEQRKSAGAPNASSKEPNITQATKKEDEDEGEEDEDEESFELSDSEVEDDSDEDDDEEEEENKDKSEPTLRQRPLRTSVRQGAVGRYSNRMQDKVSKFFRGSECHRGDNGGARSVRRLDFPRSDRRSLPDRRSYT